MCPTGTLVHAYRERLPTHPNIVIETIHSAIVYVRVGDEVVKYAPPTRLRRFDLFLIDEASQIEDPVAIRLQMALSELPHDHTLVVAADYRQLQPIAGGGEVLRWCLKGMDPFYLTEVHRTNDPQLLSFLQTIRKDQPSRSYLQKNWRPRTLPADLSRALRVAQVLQQRRGHHFMWLCVTNKGADRINSMSLTNLGVSEAQRKLGYDGDPNVKAGIIFIQPGLWIRLCRNLEKTRGFVNGALAQVVDVLSKDRSGRVNVFTARLSTGAMVLVHPITIGQRTFLPCCYGYATTIRRSQGSSLHLGALYFDHCYPPDRGYGYVGASRFRSLSGLFHYGRVRRSDWLPIGAVKPHWDLARTSASISDDSARVLIRFDYVIL